MKRYPSVLKKIGFGLLTISMSYAQSLDTSFDTDGKVTTAIADGNNAVYDMVIQPDGKIVVVGFANNGTDDDIAIARYNTDGSLDLSFNGTGSVIFDNAAGNDIGYGIALQSDGKVLVAGSSMNGTYTDFIVLRLNSNGSMDNSFDTDGKVTTDFNGNSDIAHDIAIQADGKIVAGGSCFMDSIYHYAVARYNTNGSLDNTFDTDGKANTLLSNNDQGMALAIQQDGKIVLAGKSLQPDFYNAFGLVRYNTNGSLDNTFDSDGKVVTSVSTYSDEAQAIQIQSDGKIVVAGKATPVGPFQFAIARYNTNGSLDNTFNSSGYILTAFGSSWDEARALTIQADGKIIAGGMATISGQKFAVARYTTSGTLDASFGTGGKLTTPFGTSSTIWALAIQADQKIVAGGSTGTAGNYDFGLVRYGDNSKPSGINELSATQTSLHVYPNPVETLLNLSYVLENEQDLTIELVDLTGKVEKTFVKNEPQAGGEHNVQLPMPEGLASGSYLVVLSSVNGRAAVRILKK